MAQVLVVEDSKVFASVIRREIESKLGFEVKWAPTYADASRLIDAEKSEFFVGLLDLNLPDAEGFEIVDFVLSKDIPSIVFTSEFSDDTRDGIISKQIIDYVLKESAQNIDYIVSLIRRIYRNRSIKVLVVDDSHTARRHICGLLRVHQYDVLEAHDGSEALRIVDEHPDIKLIITDYNMPNIDGFELTTRIRHRYRKEELAVIGISAYGYNRLSARFIKNGANDFINKPFENEEFYCRVTQNIEIIEHLQAIKESSNRDYLTDLYNRRYLFDVGEKLHANSKRGNLGITTAMIDIDYFKKVNDMYGHNAGDAVLRKVASILKSNVRESDVVARFGGEEFCILATNMSQEHIHRVFDHLRESIEQSEIHTGNPGQKTRVTVSIGVCVELLDSFEDMIKQADVMLYEAKRGGRNRVML